MLSQEEKRDLARQLIVVLGMHRSGTSMLMRSLQVLGVGISSNLLGKHECNPEGFFEDARLVSGNNSILASANLRWNSLEQIPAELLASAARSEAGDAGYKLLESILAEAEIMAIKDPRMCRLMPFWRPLLEKLPAKISYILALRHPYSVAYSLLKRQKINLESELAIKAGRHALYLWALHTLNALEGSYGLRRKLVISELLLENPEDFLTDLAKWLNLSIKPKALEEFLTSFLDHNLWHFKTNVAWLEKEEPPCAILVKQIYNTLIDCAKSPTWDNSNLRKSQLIWLKQIWTMLNAEHEVMK